MSLKQVAQIGKVFILIMALVAAIVVLGLTVGRGRAQSSGDGLISDPNQITRAPIVDPNGEPIDPKPIPEPQPKPVLPIETLLSRDVVEQVGKRDKHHRHWDVVRTFEITDPCTQETRTEERVSKIVEVGGGICYQDEFGDWQLTDTRWQATRDGFVMNKANYQLEIGATLGSWLKYTVDGDDMLLRPTRLEAEDGAQVVTLAEVDPNTVGQIDPCDATRLVFANAFGKGIDIVLRAAPDRIHQDVVFHQAPQIPARLARQDTNVRLYTEMNLDETIEQKRIGVGIGKKEFWEKPTDLNTAPTKERIEYFKIKKDKAGNDVGDTKHFFADSEVFDAGQDGNTKRTQAFKQLYRSEDHKTYLIETLDENFLANATYPVTWDYQNVNDPIDDDVWHAGVTYYVSSNAELTVGTSLRIEPGAVVKLDEDIELNFRGDVVVAGDPYCPIYFTSAYDDTVGESVATGDPDTKRWQHCAFYGYSAAELEFCRFRYATQAVRFFQQTAKSFAVRHCIFRDCNYGATVSYQPSYLQEIEFFNNLFYDGDKGVYIYAYGSASSTDDKLIVRNNTCANFSVYGLRLHQHEAFGSDTDRAIIENNLITDCAIGIQYNKYSGTVYEPFCRNNAFYGYSSAITGFSTTPSFEDLSESPYAASGAMGDYYIKRTWTGDDPICDGGYQTDVTELYPDSSQWAIRKLDDADRVFTSTTTISTDTVWRPQSETCDTGQVAIGYHHPRVDYVLNNASLTAAQADTDFVILPGTVIAQKPDAGLICGLTVDGSARLEIRGAPWDGGYVKWVSLPFTSMDLTGGSRTDSAIEFMYTNTLNEITFAHFIGFSCGVGLYSSNVSVHDSVFSLCSIGVYKEESTGILQNCLFLNNWAGLYLYQYTAQEVYAIRNCTFHGNSDSGIRVPEYSLSSWNVTNSILTNNETAMWRSSSSPIGVADYNLFFGNTADFAIDSHGANSMSDELSGGQYTGQLPYATTWSNWEDQFRLSVTSDACDMGYDPQSEGMPGFTTQADNSEDAAPIDVGYHYLIGTQDTDGDGLPDGVEHSLGTDPAAGGEDSDGDGMWDGWEYKYGLDPTDASDGVLNPDGDNYDNAAEYYRGFDPYVADATGSAIDFQVGPTEDITSIQMAINYSADGDTITVAQNTYNEHIDFLGKAITVTGTDPDNWSIIEGTVIDAGADAVDPSPTVRFVSGEGLGSVLRGVKVTGGFPVAAINPPLPCGGGIMIDGTSPTIECCIIESNSLGTLSSLRMGGGVACVGGALRCHQ